MTIPVVLQTKAKAFAGAVVAGVGAYLITALKANQTVTLRGLENAAVLAAAAFLTVHQTVNRKPKGKHAKGQPAHTVVHRVIPETRVDGRRLGRVVRHDSRSLNYQVKPDGTAKTVRWNREIPVLDQGDVGSCTGNAATGALGTTPVVAGLPASVPTSKLTESFALTIYSAAETIDGDGPYPPQDHGSSGLSVAKACKNAGLISAYLHITSLAAAKTAIQQGSLLKGSDWFTGMDSPDSTGLVTATGTVRGGHEYHVIGFDVDADLWECVNSWGLSYGVQGHFFMSSATFSKLLGDGGDVTLFVPNPVVVPTPPAPSQSIILTDARVVAKMLELAAKRAEDVVEYTTDRLKAIYHLGSS